MDITKAQRDTILTKIEAVVSEKYFEPAFDDAAWLPQLVDTAPPLWRQRTRRLLRRPLAQCWPNSHPRRLASFQIELQSIRAVRSMLAFLFRPFF